MDVTNPFENPEAQYVVLVNDENQHSLWPLSISVPDGWTIAHGESSREDCLQFIETNWTDMRPRSLVEAMDGGEGSAA